MKERGAPPKLGPDGQALIAGRVFLRNEAHAQLSREYGVSPHSVGRYVSKHESGDLREKAIEAARIWIANQESLAHGPEIGGADATPEEAAAPVAGAAGAEGAGPAACTNEGPVIALQMDDRNLEAVKRMRAFARLMENASRLKKKKLQKCGKASSYRTRTVGLKQGHQMSRLVQHRARPCAACRYPRC